MKKYFLILIAAAALASCSKDKSDLNDPNDPGQGNSATRVKTFADGGGVTTFTYDGQGRILQNNYSNGAKVVYEYSPGLVIRKMYTTAGVFDYSYKMELDANGRIARTTLSNNPNYEVLDLYTADGFLVKSISHINGNNQTIDYFRSNGNLDSMRFSGNNGWNLTTVKTYYTDKTNVLGSEVFGQGGLAGAPNKNLLKTDQYKYSDGSAGDISSFSYEFDGNGRVIKKTISQGANLNIELLSYFN